MAVRDAVSAQRGLTMTRPFLPPPVDLRCCAVTFEGYYCAHCPYPRVKGSDVCETHRDMEKKGRRVRRVSPPRATA